MHRSWQATEKIADVEALALYVGVQVLTGYWRVPQVCRANAAAGQQRRSLATVCLEDVEDQRNRVEGGEVAVQHAG